MIDRIVVGLCGLLPRGGYSLAKAARQVLPSLADFPAKLRFAPIEVRGDIAQNIFYPLALRGYYAHQTVEDDLLAMLAKRSSVIVDVGANIGYTAALMASFAPHARIMAFEPLPLCWPYLQQFAALQSNIELHTSAVGAKPGTARFLQRQSIDRSSLAGKGEAPVAGVLDVDVTTLDLVLSDAPVDLIKIDVEGFEPEVLEGGRSTIARHRPFVVFEAYEQYVLDFARAYFASMGGYVIYIVNAGGTLRVLDQKREVASDTCNFVAWPKSRDLPNTLEIPRCYER